jgi:hypothetical protein
MVQQRKYVGLVGYSTLFSGLLSMFAVDILQIPSRCIQIYCVTSTWLWVFWKECPLSDRMEDLYF